MLPGPAVPGCCLDTFHFLWAILSTGTVYHPSILSIVILILPVLVAADVEAEDLVHVDALVVEEVGRVLAVRVLLREVL